MSLVLSQIVSYLFSLSMFKELAKDTNILTNMVPEVKNNWLWNRLEEYCRNSLTNDFETIYVMSGTLFLPKKEGDGREFVKYEVSIVFARKLFLESLSICLC